MTFWGPLEAAGSAGAEVAPQAAASAPPVRAAPVASARRRVAGGCGWEDAERERITGASLGGRNVQHRSPWRRVPGTGCTRSDHTRGAPTALRAAVDVEEERGVQGVGAGAGAVEVEAAGAGA